MNGLFRANIKITVQIQGCPDKPLEALEWRRHRGLPERLDDIHEISVHGEISEQDFRRLVNTHEVWLSETANGGREVGRVLGRVQIPVTATDTDIDLAVRAIEAWSASCREAIEDMVRRLVALPDEAWFGKNGVVLPLLTPKTSFSGLWEEVRKSPEIQDKIARLRPAWEARRAEEEARRAEEEALVDAEETQIAAWAASRNDTIAKGIANGYEMTAAVCAEIEAVVNEVFCDAEVECFREDTHEWDERQYDRRRNPSAVALSTLLRTRERLTDLRSALPECVVVDDPQISRVEMRDGKYTAVTIHVHAQHDTIPEMIVEIGVES